MSLQVPPTLRVVVTDTNILINLIHIGRLDLLGKLPPYSFVVSEEVVNEVREPAQFAGRPNSRIFRISASCPTDGSLACLTRTEVAQT
jgi:hypothetical protein